MLHATPKILYLGDIWFVTNIKLIPKEERSENVTETNKQDGVEGEGNDVARQPSQELIHMYMRASSFSQHQLAFSFLPRLLWRSCTLPESISGVHKLRVRDSSVSLMGYLLERLKLQNMCKHSTSSLYLYLYLLLSIWQILHSHRHKAHYGGAG